MGRRSGSRRPQCRPISGYPDTTVPLVSFADANPAQAFRGMKDRAAAPVRKRGGTAGSGPSPATLLRPRHPPGAMDRRFGITGRMLRKSKRGGGGGGRRGRNRSRISSRAARVNGVGKSGAEGQERKVRNGSSRKIFGGLRKPMMALPKMARETGLEPATSGVTGRRSNQLSYSRAGRNRAAAEVGLKGACAPSQGACESPFHGDFCTGDANNPLFTGKTA